MKSNKIKILLLFCLGGILILPGCSSTSNTIRYNTPQDTDSNTSGSAIRFSSDNNNTVKSPVNDTAGMVNNSNLDEDDDTDNIPDSEIRKSVDMSSLIERYDNSNGSSSINSDKGTPKEKMLMEIIKYLNTPYKYGGDTKRGIDCSAFTQTVYEKTLSIQLNRTAREQYTEGNPINSIEDLKFGDLVFFDTRSRVKPGHVGIYIGNNLFAHASSKFGVIVSSFDDDYYKSRFMGGRRIEDLLGSKDNTSSTYR
jgi:cell wall-associated NlpC family hydrolase